MLLLCNRNFISDIWFPIKIQNGTVSMTEIKLKCGSSVCDYVTQEVSVEIAFGLLQFHSQAREVSLKIKEEVKGFKRVPRDVNLMPRGL